MKPVIHRPFVILSGGTNEPCFSGTVTIIPDHSKKPTSGIVIHRSEMARVIRSWRENDPLARSTPRKHPLSAIAVRLLEDHLSRKGGPGE